jgi:hypothetical protein
METTPRVLGRCTAKSGFRRACRALPLWLVAVSGLSAAEVKIEQLAWLAGTWKQEKGGRVVTERWTAPEGGVMLGTSQTVRDGRTLGYEFVALRPDAKTGTLIYHAHPSGQKPAEFSLVRATAREAVFENPQHDFPQRIVYSLQPDGSLLAAVEGSREGKTRRLEFLYRPVK